MTITDTSLLMTMSDIAALAHVQRPVVSVWRSRAAGTDAPFPAPISRQRGVDLFDAGQVGGWLERTGRGNNREATADAAAYAVSARHDFDEVAFRGVTALLALREAGDHALGGLTAAELLDAADEHDPDDDLLFREVDALGTRLVALAEYVDALVEAAYGPAPAFERMLTDRAKRNFADEGDLTLSRAAIDLMTHTVTALRFTQHADSVVVDPTGSAGDLLVAIHEAHPRDLPVLTANDDDPAARLQRRRLMVHGIVRTGVPVQPSGAFTVDGSAVHIAQYPSAAQPTMTPVEMLSAIDDIVLQLTDQQLAVVLAPATVLTDIGLSPEADQLRSSLLRSGRVRAIVRLPAGMLSGKPQQLQAIWVLGAAHTQHALADRYAMVADLVATPLDTAVIDDLVSDLVASLGDRSTVRAHSFRFARLALTRTLLASRQPLIAGVDTVAVAPEQSAAALAIDIDRLVTALHSDLTVFPATPDQSSNTMTVHELLTAGHLRYIPGNRIAAEDVIVGKVDGIRLIGPAEVANPTELGHRSIDRLRFAAGYPSGRVTEPGDVVFCTSPKPAALVDTEGTSVVLFPARILRIDRADPNGLLAEVLAADIAALPPGHRRWRAWKARQVALTQRAALADALTSLRWEQKQTRDRLGQLDELTDLLMTGITAGTITLASNAPSKGTT
ncbi:hypothetical protein E3O06_04285 [Cryobacterium glaciale]|uniref:DNA methylase adenine-specific domain-containing protein n=1 Tax=Cryobacterium glaciale TaxID=1259145 RepID=A0A4R8V377_9MICO|nr:hypothetical protein [Cryobacterium glaciale]TFB75864.1 hypothetical protein E3O06_04285 [Cryobacterium glaciale]